MNHQLQSYQFSILTYHRRSPYSICQSPISTHWIVSTVKQCYEGSQVSVIREYLDISERQPGLYCGVSIVPCMQNETVCKSILVLNM